MITYRAGIAAKKNELVATTFASQPVCNTTRAAHELRAEYDFGVSSKLSFLHVKLAKQGFQTRKLH
jgi:hypothetical protein